MIENRLLRLCVVDIAMLLGSKTMSSTARSLLLIKSANSAVHIDNQHGGSL